MNYWNNYEALLANQADPKKFFFSFLPALQKYGALNYYSSYEP